MNMLFQTHEVIFLLIFLSWFFWIWMLLECVVKEMLTGQEKIGWVILITTTYFLGALLYFICRRPKRIHEVGE